MVNYIRVHCKWFEPKSISSLSFVSCVSCVRFVVFVNISFNKVWVVVVFTENVVKVLGFVG